MKPTDPVSENMDALGGNPIKAFMYPRPSGAHRYSPSLYARPYDYANYWSKPNGNQIMSSLQAHIAEHYGLYVPPADRRADWCALPAPNEEMPEIGSQLAQLQSKAAIQLTQAHEQQAAQQQAQQQHKTPLSRCSSKSYS